MRVDEVFREFARNQRARLAPDLAQRLDGIVAACRAAWPALDVPEHVFVRHVAENFPVDGDLDDGIAQMQCTDLYLACACVAQDPAALAAFDGTILSRTTPVLQRMGLSASQIDEVIQILRTRLLVGDERGRSPVLASYAGRGALVGWVRTAARRTALSLRRNMDEQIGGDNDDRELGRIPVPVDAELDYLRNRYREEFQRAVEDAIATLDTDQLRALRLYYRDALSVDRVGALLGVHRATAARWVRAASDVVRDETRRLLHTRLGLSAAELESLAGLVQSQLHLSLGRLFASHES